MNDISRSIEQSKNITQEDLDKMRKNVIIGLVELAKSKGIYFKEMIIEDTIVPREDVLKEYNSYINEANKIS